MSLRKCHARIQKVLAEGTNSYVFIGFLLLFFFCVFFFGEGREGPNTTKSGPSSAR